MAVIYIIAGPPGIGKSTSGVNFIPDETSILDADLIAHRYKQQGFSDYKDIGNWRFQDILRNNLVSGNDFAVELNLGFQSHYDLLKKLKGFNKENKIEVILFHTNDLQLCLDRARIRHENGLHLVPPDTIREMYNNTMPLLIQNIGLVSGLVGLDVRRDQIVADPFLKFDRANSELKIFWKPEWLNAEIVELLEGIVIIKDAKQSQASATHKLRRKRGRGI